MNPIVYAIPVFMLTIVVEAFIAWRRKKPAYDIPDALTSLHAGVLSRLSEVFVRVVTGGFYIAIWQNYRAFDLPATNPLVWIGALLAYDLCYYWNHRLGHEMNIMWAAHVVHHSSEYFNLSTALRQSSTSALFGWMFYLILAVIGIPPQVFAIVALIDLLYQYWVHTELIGRMGILDRIMVTPSNHRVHHGQNDYCIDKNYGGIFIFWDRLFGTFADERAGEKIIYGIRKPLASYNPVWTNLHTYAWLWREMMAAKGWRAKLAVWFAPPTGWRGTDIPAFDANAFTRYDRHATGTVRWYAVAQYAVTTVLVTHFMAMAPQMSWGERGAYAAVILATALSIGALLEGRAYARAAEMARVIILGGLFAGSPDWFGFTAPLAVKASVLIAGLASATWLFVSGTERRAGAAA
jgi:sterol desaturase/sphingolipid hydroxylase (fatty acid hydroxylase superfamily)